MKIPTLPRLLELCLLCLLAFAFLWRGGKGIEATWLLAIIGPLLVLVAHWMERKLEHQKDLPIVLWACVMLFILWTVLSYVCSFTSNYGLDEVLRDGALFLLFLWMMRRFRFTQEPIVLKRTISLLIFLAFMGCLIGAAVYFFQPVSRFVGTFLYFRRATDYWPNAWAEALLLTWPLVFLWAQSTRLPLQRFLRGALLGVVLGCLLLTFSRGGFLVLAGQWVLLLLLRYRAKSGPSLATTVRAALLVAVFASVTFVGCNAVRGQFHVVESLTRKATFTADEGTSSLTERFSFFRQAVTLTEMRPLFGWGPYSFRFVQPRLQDQVLATSDHPHNVFLKLSMERGVLATAFFLAILLLSLWGFARSWRSAGFPMSVLFVAVAGVIAHNLIDYNLQFLGIALPFTLFLGALASPLLTPSSPSTQKMMRWVEVLVACLILIVAGVEGTTLVLSSLGRHAEAAGNPKAALSWYALSEAERFSRDLELSRAELLIAQSQFQEARNALQMYIQRNAEDARAWKRLSEVDSLLFDSDSALQAAQQAFLLGRYNDIAISTDYLLLVAQRGDATAVADLHDPMFTLLHEYDRAITSNAHFIALSKNVEGFERFSTILAQLYPSDATALKAENAQVQAKAKDIRSESAARPLGYLW